MNQLKLSQQQSILTLHKAGWSNRAIARELHLNRETVAKYLRVQNAPSAETTRGTGPPKPAISTPGSWLDTAAKPAISTAGSVAGRKSGCAAWEEQITTALEKGLSAQRIYQDLVTEYQFIGSYQSVKRFVRRLGAATPLPWRRMECEPGLEVQVDFGKGAWIEVDGKRKRPHVFRVVLSHSRKGYSEAVWQQTTENFIRCLENAFRYFGGVPHTTVIDNLRAAVTRADWFDPQLNPKIVSFAEHYQTVILPTKPYTPRHKGKIEAGIKYVQNNALQGRLFHSLAEENQFLLEWESRVADTRIHGTTRQQVAVVFNTSEKPRLLPLPAMVFPVFAEAPRTVHRDGHVEVARTYYSVPPEYVGRKVWARWELRLVRIFNTRMEQIALHARQQPGRFSTDPAHIHSRKRSAIENGLDWLLDRARMIGPHSADWAEAMIKNRGPQGIRVLQGFLQLAAKHAPANVEAASQLASTHGGWHLRELKDLLQHPTAQEQFQFIQQHPLIRDLSHYQALIPDCFTPESQTDNNATESSS
ncbi:MAG: IS21 family transposase [Verrucomicrobiota bacterium]|jgi:transposase